MKLQLLKIFFILIFSQVVLAYQTNDFAPFKTGEIELFSSFTNADRQQRSFLITSDHRPGDQIAINLLDLKVSNDILSNPYSITGWEL